MQLREGSYRVARVVKRRFRVNKLTQAFQVCHIVIILLRLVLPLVSYS